MKTWIFIVSLLIIDSASLSPAVDDSHDENQLAEEITGNSYNSIGNKHLSLEVFDLAYKGYVKWKAGNIIEKPDIITIIDFDKPSDRERFFVIDMKNGEILYETLVAHGRNSGDIMATAFSNEPGSKKSSLGFFLTGETYFGQHGLSLRLDGLMPGINDNARSRDIVIHSADYVSRQFITQNGRLGRSFGCPSLPKENYDKIIETIKGKSLLFIYSGNVGYLAGSAVFQ